jgi:hypothetical protein
MRGESDWIDRFSEIFKCEYLEAELVKSLILRESLIFSLMRARLHQPKPELEGELGPTLTGKNLIASKKSGKFWIISESFGGPFIAKIRTDVPANFLSRNGAPARAGCGEKSK